MLRQLRYRLIKNFSQIEHKFVIHKWINKSDVIQTTRSKFQQKGKTNIIT